MDEKLRIEIEEIIECKNCFGFFVFNPSEKTILRELFFNDSLSPLDVCDKHGLAEEHLMEITRAFESVREELKRISEEENKELVRKKDTYV